MVKQNKQYKHALNRRENIQLISHTRLAGDLMLLAVTVDYL